jgi:D-arabinose 1-dehydrogenase-like Zn-dependent alcohol dehydrogenase
METITQATAVAEPSLQDPEQMRAAFYHNAGEPFSIEIVDRPKPGPTDVLVQLQACSFVPNLVSMLNPPPPLIAPARPSSYGLDPVGVITAKGASVYGFEIGDRVYVNPHRFCQECHACRKGHTAACEYSAFNGYFGIGAKSAKMLADYPYGGFAEYMIAPQYTLVRLPDMVSSETATRWGYLGTGYAALKRAGVGIDTTVFINGISGTLGLGTALLALALGAPKVFGVGHDIDRLNEVKAIDPERIMVASVDAVESVGAWVQSETSGVGADVVIDALPTFCSTESYKAGMDALARGGTHVNIGGVIEEVPLNVNAMMHSQQTFTGSFWFTTAQGEEMTRLVEQGLLDLGVLDNVSFDLNNINQALETVTSGTRNGGFTNFVITMP